MSGGRFELGVGRGISPYELGYHGVDAAEAPAMYREALELLLCALTQEEVSFEGRWWRCDAVPMVLQPCQKPHPPLWYACGTPEAAAWPARHGINIVTNGPTPRIAEILARYRAEWTGTGPMPCLGLSRAIVLAEDAAEAREAARRAWRVHAGSFLTLWRRHGSDRRFAQMTDGFDAAQEAGLGFAGTPAEVRDALLRQLRETGANYLVSRFAFGDLSPAEMLRSARLFAEEVMPALAEQHRQAG